jgi:signal transduction histidine kinase
MSPYTATSFVFLGIALLCVDRRGGKANALSQWLALGAALLPLVTLAGYAFDERRLYAFGRDVGMAMHTALGMLLLSLGLVSLRPQHGLTRVVMDMSAGGVMARRLLPTVLLPPALGALVALCVREGQLDEGLAWPFFTVTTMVAFAALIWRNAAHLNEMHAAQRLAAERALAHAERQATLAAENERLYLAAERASRQREDVLAIVSHDLKNPLSTVRLSVAVLQRKLPALPEEARGMRKQVEAIERAVNLMQGLITRLLDAARLDAGQALAVEPRPEDLTALVTEALAVIEPLAADKGLRLELHLTPGLQAPCDRDRILQVLANLLGNAVKFTPGGGTLSVEAIRLDGAARVAVRDSGPGIPEAQRARIFERHWQAGGQDARQGSGLGLYIAQGIIAAHGGHIEVQSVSGQGSTFAFTLPLTAAQQPTSDA